jgi:hypothetical protein
LAISKNKGNKDKAVRRYKEAICKNTMCKNATYRNKMYRNGRHIIPNLTLKIVSRNKVVDLGNLMALAPYIAYTLT